MRALKIILLVIVLIAILFGILFFVVNVSEETEKDVIDPDKYDKGGDSLISKDSCSSDGQCREEFNSYWSCNDVLGKCLCFVSDNYGPVCGVDGKDYSNPSEANCAGIEVDYNGECGDRENEDYFCGDGFCEAGVENSQNCQKDCLPGCGDGECQEVVCSAIGCPEPETTNNCPQDCKDSGTGNTCTDIRNKINVELQKVIACSSDDECIEEDIEGFAGNSGAFCCGEIYNKNADLSTLKSLDKEYQIIGDGITSCPQVLCACADPTGVEVKCVNNKCGYLYP